MYKNYIETRMIEYKVSYSLVADCLLEGISDFYFSDKFDARLSQCNGGQLEYGVASLRKMLYPERQLRPKIAWLYKIGDNWVTEAD